ncbi:MAG: ClpXP protease specificity-enhancing factor [Burkholderiales bacterium]|nr:ClpXP protease specificity-enhancing factor [Burkholderiales bacterium]
MAEPTASTSTRPYLLRALHDWCTDNGYTPYIAVAVGPGVQVPMEYVKNNEIVLNIGFEATSSLQLGNELVEFKARFGGVAREIKVPVDHVIAIYARENGQGMAFPMPNAEGAEAGPAPTPAPVRGLRLASTESEGPIVDEAPATTAEASAATAASEPPEPPDAPGGGRPALKRVK